MDLEDGRLARARVLRYVRHCLRRTPKSQAAFDAGRLGRLAFAEGLHLA